MLGVIQEEMDALCLVEVRGPMGMSGWKNALPTVVHMGFGMSEGRACLGP